MTIKQHSTKERIGFVGLSGAGTVIARSLLITGQRVLGYDNIEQARTVFSESGGMLARTVEEIVRGCPTVFVCLPDTETFVDVAEVRLVPHAHAGQVFVDMSVVTPRQIRRFARNFARKGAVLIDAPVAPSLDGGAEGGLRVFCGGDLDTFNKVRPLLNTISSKENVIYCGPSGCGQILKGVDQLAAGLMQAAVLEAVAYGVNAGISAETIREVVGGPDGWRSVLSGVCASIDKNEGDGVGIRWNQYAMFLDEAQDKGFDLPVALALYHFLAGADKTVREPGGLSPSFWRELTSGAASRRAARGQPSGDGPS